MRYARPQKSDHGFTLFELIVALAVAGVLLTIALPSMRTLIQDTRVVSKTNELVASLNFARSEAVKRNTTVSLCASNDGIACTDTAWNEGWIVFTDADVPGAVDAGDSVLRVQQALDGGVTVTLTGAVFVSYLPNGMLVADCEHCIDDNGSGSRKKHRLTRVLWALVPIGDAVAQTGDRQGTGGYDSGCSAEVESNNVNSERCSDNTNNPGGAGGVGGGGVVGPATFVLCDGGRAGETGRAVNVALTGRVRTSKIACD